MSATIKTLWSLSINDIGERVRVDVDGSVVEGTLRDFHTDVNFAETRGFKGTRPPGSTPLSKVTLVFPIGPVVCDIRSRFQVIEDGVES